jgi:hypothetical protein
MKMPVSCLLFPLLLVLSCTSKPAAEASAVPFPAAFAEPVPPGPIDGPAVPVPEPVAAESLIFDPGNVSREVYNYTKLDVQNFIENLNRIIRARNYEGWAANLGGDYFKEKNSPEYLLKVSEQPRLKTQGIVLANARDYFINVVVPSRSRDRVDDIEFVNQRRVKAYTVTEDGQRLRLYDLEYVNGVWKIVN